MKQVKRWRYYCDHCKKSGGSKGHIVKHERGCTKNPNRVCGVCDFTGESQPDLQALIAFVERRVPMLPTEDYFNGSRGANQLVDELEKLANGCPACTLAAMRQARGQFYPSQEHWNVKAKFRSFWIEYEKVRDRPQIAYGGY